MRVDPMFLALIIPFSLLFLGACNHGTVEFVNSPFHEAQESAELLQPPKARCCIEGENVCFLGYEFSSHMRDEQHEEGGYLVKRIVGDCKCQYENGEWNVLTVGNIDIYSGILGSINKVFCQMGNANINPDPCEWCSGNRCRYRKPFGWPLPGRIGLLARVSIGRNCPENLP